MLPVAVFWLLRSQREAIKYDQILRVSGLGDDRLSNPKYYTFRKTWGKLYQHFKPGKWYFEIVILTRKALLAFTSLMFSNTPSYQLSMSLLVMFAAFVVHMRNLPYMSHLDRPKVLAEHIAKAATDPLHASIEADMRAVQKRNVRKRTRVTALSEVPKRPVSLAIMWTFDANTVEAVLLACCVLINLAGIMFDSGRFSGYLSTTYATEYNSLAIAAALLILTSVAYYVVVLLVDLSMTLCPERVAPAIASATCSATQKRAERSATSKLAAGAAQLAGDESAAQASAMQVNPFMLSAAAAGAEGSSATSTALGVLDPSYVDGIQGEPNATLWAAVKDSYRRIHSTVVDVTKTLQEVRKEHDILQETVGNMAARHVVARTKNSFSPTTSAQEGSGVYAQQSSSSSDAREAHVMMGTALANVSNPLQQLQSFRSSRGTASFRTSSKASADNNNAFSLRTLARGNSARAALSSDNP